jgi:hypothetical protein
MADRKRIGLREVRAIGPGEEIWDAAIPGFGARRQKSTAVSYVLMYRTRATGRAEQPLYAQRLRDEAWRVRRDADRITAADIRKQLLNIAAQYDRLAETAEDRLRWNARAAHYREQAAQLREIAKGQGLGRLRDDLTNMADQYDRLASQPGNRIAD